MLLPILITYYLCVSKDIYIYTSFSLFVLGGNASVKFLLFAPKHFLCNEKLEKTVQVKKCHLYASLCEEKKHTFRYGDT